MATMLGMASPTPRACPVAERERMGVMEMVVRDRTRSQYDEQLFKIPVLVAANPTDCLSTGNAPLDSGSS